MNPLLEQIYKTGCVEDEHGTCVNPFPDSIRWNKGAALYRVIREADAAKTLEVGMGYGLSTLFICQALADNGGGHHVAIDPYERTQWRSIGLLNLHRANLAHLVDFLESPAHSALPKLLDENEKFDVIFIDGMHLFDYTLVEFFYADRVLRPGGFLVFDDLWMPSIRKAIAFILRNRHYELPGRYWDKPSPMWRRCRRFVRNLLHQPFDIYTSGFPVAMGSINHCVLQKISDDDRHWRHYRSF